MILYELVNCHVRNICADDHVIMIIDILVLIAAHESCLIIIKYMHVYLFPFDHRKNLIITRGH